MFSTCLKLGPCAAQPNKTNIPAVIISSNRRPDLFIIFPPNYFSKDDFPLINICYHRKTSIGKLFRCVKKILKTQVAAVIVRSAKRRARPKEREAPGDGSAVRPYSNIRLKNSLSVTMPQADQEAGSSPGGSSHCGSPLEKTATPSESGMNGLSLRAHHSAPAGAARHHRNHVTRIRSSALRGEAA